MGGRYVALLRGINVGRAKRVAMQDLRAVVEDLGFSEVRTLLNSGNVAFGAPGSSPGNAAERIEAALAARLGVSSRVTVLAAAELAHALRDNPLAGVASDPSRLLVAVPAGPADREALLAMAEHDWAPEALAVGTLVAYLWCPAGVSGGRLFEAVNRELGDGVTCRNWTTMTRLLGLAQPLGR